VRSLSGAATFVGAPNHSKAPIAISHPENCGLKNHPSIEIGPKGSYISVAEFSRVRCALLRLGKRAEYALIALAHLAQRPEGIASAREIAQSYRLPLPLMMKLLKNLHHKGLVKSIRGVHGGYQLAADLRSVSLEDLMQMLLPVPAASVAASAAATSAPSAPAVTVNSPLTALRFKMQRFVRDVKLSDLILPGRRIDVPVELVGIEKSKAGLLAGVSS
jgi:Rrf2 family protein